jgi:hypothetical protein
MTESATYNVILSGNLLCGFDNAGAVDSFAKLFKLPHDKASAMVGTKMVIKKEIELTVAQSYQQKLATIGIDVTLKKQGDVSELSLELSLEPMQERVADTDGSKQQISGGNMICPKCKFNQPQAEKCSHCGVFIHKVIGHTDDYQDT